MGKVVGFGMQHTVNMLLQQHIEWDDLVCAIPRDKRRFADKEQFTRWCYSFMSPEQVQAAIRLWDAGKVLQPWLLYTGNSDEPQTIWAKQLGISNCDQLIPYEKFQGGGE